MLAHDYALFRASRGLLQTTNFLNRLMNPDPAKRLTASQALQDDFMTAPLLEEDQARGILKKLLAPQGPPQLEGLDEVPPAGRGCRGASREPTTPSRVDRPARRRYVAGQHVLRRDDLQRHQ